MCGDDLIALFEGIVLRGEMINIVNYRKILFVFKSLFSQNEYSQKYYEVSGGEIPI